MKQFYFLFLFLSFSYSVISAKCIRVVNNLEFNDKVKALNPGDSIILANGVWKNARLIFKGNGQKDNYIYLAAETAGKVLIEGKSYLQMSGKWLHVSGLVFVDGYSPLNSVIDFKTGYKEYAYNCVLSECVIDKFNKPSKDSADHWIGVYGKHNTIEKCYLAGKTNIGATLVVWPNDTNSIHNGHLIYRNYFGPRPRLLLNGGETIRIGTSQVSTKSSETIVDGNYFEHCNGESEIISNKSTDNKFLNNTFFECEGSLVLRHGNRAIVTGNWFIGNGRKFTGGIRVINEGHLIFNNFFYKLRGEEFRSALAIMNAILNSPAYGYAPVKNVVIANNTYYDCAFPWAFGVGSGKCKCTVRPEEVSLINNLVYCPNTDELVKEYDHSDRILMDNNLMINSKGLSNEKGAISGNIIMGKVGDFDIVYTNAKAKISGFGKLDIQGQTRYNETVIGSFQNIAINSLNGIATSKNCGPNWYISRTKSKL